ncbi:hypothetical protein AS594_08760 [Streptomyces agglomeratus]|uniref:Uncharacterized protein n=1 Tax=Streptomyces agglomeratus TaxID=285458 RepID=A0A1E5P517_9ACTN|nr:hypothetical protein AS594_08760 [Streptomyces agglomeratus]
MTTSASSASEMPGRNAIRIGRTFWTIPGVALVSPNRLFTLSENSGSDCRHIRRKNTATAAVVSDVMATPRDAATSCHFAYSAAGTHASNSHIPSRAAVESRGGSSSATSVFETPFGSRTTSPASAV